MYDCLFVYWLLNIPAACECISGMDLFVLVSCGHFFFFFQTLTISVLYFNQICSKWFFAPSCVRIFLVWAYVYMDSWIRCRVALYAFFLKCFNILCYASGFYMLLFIVRCLWCTRVGARVCVLFIGIVQHNWACLTWKSAIEIKSLLLLYIIITISAQTILHAPTLR